LRRHAQKRKGARALPALWLFTDPGRVPDPVAAAARLPRGAGVVYRGFGRAVAEDEARALVQVARQRGLVLLIGQDAELAAKVGAHGVHLPERAAARARRLRAVRPRWIITLATHSAVAVARSAHCGVDGVFLSAIFPSRSPSAGAPLGVVRLAAIVRSAPVAVFALGGVGLRSAGRLGGTGVSGFAAVEALCVGVRT
jgi:thiamine-phosphate pyrophosphorylase